MKHVAVLLSLASLAAWVDAAAPTPAHAQTTVQCTGVNTDTPAANKTVRVDAGARTCVVTDGGSSLPDATPGSIGVGLAQENIDILTGDIRNGIHAIVRLSGGGASQQLADFTTCNIPGGANVDTRCRRLGQSKANPTIGGGTAIFVNDQGAVTVTLTLTYTNAALNSTDITAATVVFDDAPAMGPTAQEKANTIAALQSGFDAVTPSLLGQLPNDGSDGGSGLAFAPTNGLGRPGNSFDFSVDLNALANAARRGRDAEYAGLLAYGEAGDAPYSAESRLTPFVRGAYVDFDDANSGADRSGHLWIVTGGVGYHATSTTTVGVLTRHRNGEARSTAMQAALSSTFWGGGGYLTTTVPGGLKLALAGLYEAGDNDISISGATGSFDSRHLTLEGRLDRRFDAGGFWIEPGVGLRYVKTEQDDYTDSSGAFVDNRDMTLGRLTYGPTVGTTIETEAAILKPFARIGGVWDFENVGDFATSAGSYSSAGNGLNAGGGIEISYLSGLTLRLAGDWTGYDTELEVWSVSGGVGAPLFLPGIGAVGYASVDLQTTAEGATAKANLRIPLGAE